MLSTGIMGSKEEQTFFFFFYKRTCKIIVKKLVSFIDS